MTAEMGKPLAEARGEVAYGVEFLRWFSEEVTRLEGGYGTTPDGRTRMITMRRPVGPCLLITPWNFPLAMGTRKIGPALAADCTVVFKPAPQTPLTALLLAEIFRQAGVPDGVLNVITTSRAAEVIEPIMRGGVLRKLSFTGSTAVGKALLAQASHTVMRTSMELGSNAAFIVFDDADHRLRRRRPRHRRRRRVRGEDAQHGRGLHRRQPHLRPARRRRRPEGCRPGCARRVPRRRRRPVRPCVCGCASRPWTAGSPAWGRSSRRPWRWPGAAPRGASRCPCRRPRGPVRRPDRRPAAACGWRRNRRSRPRCGPPVPPPDAYRAGPRWRARRLPPPRRRSRGRPRPRPAGAARGNVSPPAGSARRPRGAGSPARGPGKPAGAPRPRRRPWPGRGRARIRPGRGPPRPRPGHGLRR